MFSELLSSVSLPVMRKVSYLPPAQQSVDPAAALNTALDELRMYISDALLSEDNLPAYVSPCNTQPLQFNAAGELDASLWS